MRGFKRRFLQSGSGVLLFVVAVAGLIHGFRATVAQWLYWECKFGFVKDYPLNATVRRAEAGHKLYPYNYYFCIWTGELAWYKRSDALGREAPERVETARAWCDRGLVMNPHKSQLRMLKTRLLARESASEAAGYWRRYADWQFWDPYNHAVLVELQAKAGDFEKALESLQWVKGSKHEEEARQHLQHAWRKEVQGLEAAAARVQGAKRE